MCSMYWEPAGSHTKATRNIKEDSIWIEETPTYIYCNIEQILFDVSCGNDTCTVLIKKKKKYMHCKMIYIYIYTHTHRVEYATVKTMGKVRFNPTSLNKREQTIPLNYKS